MSKTYTVSSTDHVEAGISTDAVAPQHPCPTCGKAMKDHNTKEDKEAGRELRICSVKTCETNGQRTIADWASGSPVVQGAAPSPLN